MRDSRDLTTLWGLLPIGARVAFEEQWAGVAAGGLPCGSSIVDAAGRVVASGRNHAYDPAGPVETRLRYALQHNRLAHAELNALACVPTETDHATLTLWTTQHPCAMCAAAMAFIGVGGVRFIADDPSDDAALAAIAATHAGVSYQPLGDPLWWTISNLLFLYNSAVQTGAEARNLRINRDRYPALVALALDLARDDAIGRHARHGITMADALSAHSSALRRVAAYVPRAHDAEVT